MGKLNNRVSFQSTMYACPMDKLNALCNEGQHKKDHGFMHQLLVQNYYYNVHVCVLKQTSWLYAPIVGTKLLLSCPCMCTEANI